MWYVCIRVLLQLCYFYSTAKTVLHVDSFIRFDSRARSASYLIAISYGSLSSACLRARWAARRVPRAKDGGLPHVLVHLAARLRDQASTMVYTATSVLTSALFGPHIAEIAWNARGNWVALRCHLVPGSTASRAPSG